jgi:hypothetical protein
MLLKEIGAKGIVMPGRKIAVAALVVLLGGCRIEITVPDGGEVATRSGNFACAAEANCTVQVEDTNFNETFVATPSAGYQFIGWKTGFKRLCGGSLSPCTIQTAWFASYENLMSLLSSDDAVAYLQPDFIPSDHIRTYQAGDVVVYTGTYSAWSSVEQPRSSNVIVRQEYLPGSRTYLDKNVLKLRTTTTFADTGEKKVAEQHVWQEANGALFELTDDYGNDYVTGGAFEKGLLSIPVPLVAFYGAVINYYTMYGGSVSGPITEGVRTINVSEPEIVVVPRAEYRAYPVSQRDSYEYLFTYVDNKSGSRIIIDRDLWISPAKGAVKEVEVRRGYARSGTLETEVRWELAAEKLNF